MFFATILVSRLTPIVILTVCFTLFGLGAVIGRYFLRQAQYPVAALAGVDFKSMLLLERDVHSGQLKSPGQEE